MIIVIKIYHDLNVGVFFLFSISNKVLGNGYQNNKGRKATSTFIYNNIVYENMNTDCASSLK